MWRREKRFHPLFSSLLHFLRPDFCRLLHQVRRQGRSPRAGGGEVAGRTSREHSENPV
jgi:hypothetical protein